MHHVQGLGQCLFAKLPPQCTEMNAFIETQPEKPCLFKLPGGRKPCCFDRLRAGEKILEFTGWWRTQNVAFDEILISMLGGAEHRRRIQAQPKIRPPLPVAHIVAGLKPGTAEV